MYRILRSKGVAVIVDLRRDASQEGIEREVKGMGLGCTDEIMTRWTFKQMLLKSGYCVPEIKEFVAQTPFGKYKIDTNDIGFQLWLEK